MENSTENCLSYKFRALFISCILGVLLEWINDFYLYGIIIMINAVFDLTTPAF